MTDQRILEAAKAMMEWEKWELAMLGTPNQAWGRFVGSGGDWLVTSDAFRRQWELEGPRCSIAAAIRAMGKYRGMR